MKKAILCIGNAMCGDDGVALEVGRLCETELDGWRVFYGEDTPEYEFGEIRKFTPEILIVVDAMSGFSEGETQFFDLSDEVSYIYSTHDLPVPVLISYLRSICNNIFFLGISVLLENVLDFNEGLSEGAKRSAKIAVEKIRNLDKNLAG